MVGYIILSMMYPPEFCIFEHFVPSILLEFISVFVFEVFLSRYLGSRCLESPLSEIGGLHHVVYIGTE